MKSSFQFLGQPKGTPYFLVIKLVLLYLQQLSFKMSWRTTTSNGIIFFNGKRYNKYVTFLIVDYLSPSSSLPAHAALSLWCLGTDENILEASYEDHSSYQRSQFPANTITGRAILVMNGTFLHTPIRYFCLWIIKSLLDTFRLTSISSKQNITRRPFGRI